MAQSHQVRDDQFTWLVLALVSIFFGPGPLLVDAFPTVLVPSRIQKGIFVLLGATGRGPQVPTSPAPISAHETLRWCTRCRWRWNPVF